MTIPKKPGQNHPWKQNFFIKNKSIQESEIIKQKENKNGQKNKEITKKYSENC
jgi:hypothetical protein